MVPGLYLLTQRRGRQRVKICLLWAAAVAAATAWWAVPLLLQGRYSFNFLPFVEQANTTTKTMSADTFLRGTGNWTAYLDLGGPWLSAGWEMVANPAAITAAAAAAAAGLFGLARRDLPDQLWLRLWVGLAAVIALAGYPGRSAGRCTGIVQSSSTGRSPRSAMSASSSRSPLWPWCSDRARDAPLAGVLIRLARRSARMAAGTVLAPVIALILAGLALPYLTGQILQPGAFRSVPRYWYQVAGFLAAQSRTRPRSWCPGTAHGIYLWGDPIDEPLEPLASSPWVERSLVPYGGAGIPGLPRHRGDRDRVRPAGPRAGRVPGAGWRPLRGGAQRPQPEAARIHPRRRPSQATLTLSGFSRVASFGPMITGDQTDPGASARSRRTCRGTRPSRCSRRPARRAAVRAGRRAAGQRDRAGQRRPGLAAAAFGQGMLGDQAAVIAGDKLAARPALWAVTDGQRRSDNAFGLTNSNMSYTYTAGETTRSMTRSAGRAAAAADPVRCRPPAIRPWPCCPARRTSPRRRTAPGSLTAAVRPGQRLRREQRHRLGGRKPGTPVGQWIQITFNHPVDLPASIGVQLLDGGAGRSVANQLKVSTAQGSVDHGLPQNATQQISVRPGRTKWLRITIARASNVIAGNPGAGISNVLIPGVRVTAT